MKRRKIGERNTDPEKIKLGKFKFDVKAKKAGKIVAIKNRSISKIARVAGAPDYAGAGIYIHKHVGDEVKKGEAIFTVYCRNKDKADYAQYAMKSLDGFIVR